jgi:hypothetical protein
MGRAINVGKSGKQVLAEGGAVIPLYKPRTYTPLLTPLERKAYQAAHRLMRDYYLTPVTGRGGDVAGGRDSGKELAGPGARRSRVMDQVAKLIMEEMGK